MAHSAPDHSQAICSARQVRTVLGQSHIIYDNLGAVYVTSRRMFLMVCEEISGWNVQHSVSWKEKTNTNLCFPLK